MKKTNVEKENRRHEDHQHHRVEIQTHNMESEKHPKNVETKALEEKKLRFIEQHKQTEERYRPTTPKVKKMVWNNKLLEDFCTTFFIQD